MLEARNVHQAVLGGTANANERTSHGAAVVRSAPTLDSVVMPLALLYCICVANLLKHPAV
jgi:hypothetical protein